MPKSLPGRCRRCGARKGEPGVKVSRRGLCYDCGPQVLEASITAMQRRSGPEWERWCANMAKIGTNPPPPRVTGHTALDGLDAAAAS